MNRKIEYNFECINPSDYKVTFTMATTSKLMRTLLDKTKKRLKKKGVNITDDLENMTMFEVDKRFYRLLYTVVQPLIKRVRKEVRPDRIEMLTNYIHGGRFIKNPGGSWFIAIEVLGQYVKK